MSYYTLLNNVRLIRNAVLLHPSISHSRISTAAITSVTAIDHNCIYIYIYDKNTKVIICTQCANPVKTDLYNVLWGPRLISGQAFFLNIRIRSPRAEVLFININTCVNRFFGLDQPNPFGFPSIHRKRRVLNCIILYLRSKRPAWATICLIIAISYKLNFWNVLIRYLHWGKCWFRETVA